MGCFDINASGFNSTSTPHESAVLTSDFGDGDLGLLPIIAAGRGEEGVGSGEGGGRGVSDGDVGWLPITAEGETGGGGSV